MQRKFIFQNRITPVKSHLFAIFLIPLSIIVLIDSAMSYAFPIVVEESLHSNTQMGIVLALSSTIGVICDFTFPQLFRKRSWKFMLMSAIVLSFFFPLFTGIGKVWSSVAFFIAASAVWGVYYEFLAFSQQEFIVDEESSEHYTKAWSIITAYANLSYILGPIIATQIWALSPEISVLGLNAFQFIAFIFMLIIILIGNGNSKSNYKSEISEGIDLIKEFKYWGILTRRIFPPAITAICALLIFATFMTIGGLLGEQLSQDKYPSWLIVVSFSIASLLGSVFMSRMNIRRGKKRLSQFALLTGALILSTLSIVKSEPTLVYIVVILASLIMSVVLPLNESVYSDLLLRAGKNRSHMLGLTRLNSSIAFIIGPLLSGFLSDMFDYYTTFTILCIAVAVVMVIMILTTPSRLKLPQKEMSILSNKVA